MNYPGKVSDSWLSGTSSVFYRRFEEQCRMIFHLQRPDRSGFSPDSLFTLYRVTRITLYPYCFCNIKDLLSKVLTYHINIFPDLIMEIYLIPVFPSKRTAYIGKQAGILAWNHLTFHTFPKELVLQWLVMDFIFPTVVEAAVAFTAFPINSRGSLSTNYKQYLFFTNFIIYHIMLFVNIYSIYFIICNYIIYIKISTF